MCDYNKFLHNNSFIRSNKESIKNIFMFKIDKGIIITNIHLLYCDDMYVKVNDLTEVSFISAILSDVVINAIITSIMLYGLTYNEIIYQNIKNALEYYINKLGITSLINYDILTSEDVTFNRIIKETILLFKNNIENVIGKNVEIGDAYSLLSEMYVESNFAFVKCDENKNVIIVELK